MERLEGGGAVQFILEESRVVFDVHPRVSAWFSTRRGGVSDPPFDSLNVSYGVGDETVRVTENRRRVVASGGRGMDELVMAHQVHDNHIEWVVPELAGRGAYGAGGIPSTDGFLTVSPTILLGMGFADCVPIFLSDQDGSFVGLLHAGWRGTAHQISRVAVQMLTERGMRPERMLVGIGPAIGRCCYEVDEPVRSQLVSAVGEEVFESTDASHWRLDLKMANRILLERAGIRSENIAVSDLCTGCRRDLFYSYRMEGRGTGRMGGYICLNPV